MSAILSQPPQRHRWTREEYHAMAETGLISPDARVELIEGEMIPMSPQRRPHVTGVMLVSEVLRAVFGSDYIIQTQGPISLSRFSEPEPDVAVLKGSIRDYHTHPTTAALIVEVSETTLGYDRTTKAGLYARADIPEYWILNLIDRQLEVHRHPLPMDGPPLGYGYRDIRVLDASERLAPLAAPEREVAVADMLP